MLKRNGLVYGAVLAWLAGAISPVAFAQQGTPLPKFGLELSAGTMGAGIQAATAVARKSNVRFGFNYFSYSGSNTSSSNNITFNGTLKMESAEILFDQYLFGGFHLSTGMAAYYGNQANGTASIPAGQTFSLNSANYYSSSASPVTGTGSFTASKYAPEVMFGFGNLLPRSNRHFTVNADLGVAFVRSPLIQLNLAGSACTINSTVGCAPIQSTPSIQSNLVAEQSKLNNQLGSYLKYWPIIRIGFGYKF